MTDQASVQVEPIELNDAGKRNLPQAHDLWLRIRSSCTWQNGKIFSYFLIWFTLSVVYNVFNKKAIEALKMPLFVASFQMATGVPIIVLTWLNGFRKPPSVFDRRIFTSLSFMALFHTGTHLGGVCSMGLGAVSFTQIIKASEPVFTAILSMLILGQLYSWQVYLALASVCIGCSIASVAELDFNFLALLFALISSLSASLRGTFSKESLRSVPVERNLQAQNLYYILTILSTFICAIICGIFEGGVFLDKFNGGLQSKGQLFVWTYLIGSGLSYYLYNEVAFLALEAVAPVTHAIGSTFKRVFIIATSLIVFQNPVNGWGYAGSVIAIIGVLLYSLAKIKYPGRTIKKSFNMSPTATSKC